MGRKATRVALSLIWVQLCMISMAVQAQENEISREEEEIIEIMEILDLWEMLEEDPEMFLDEEKNGGKDDEE